MTRSCVDYLHLRVSDRTREYEVFGDGCELSVVTVSDPLAALQGNMLVAFVQDIFGVRATSLARIVGGASKSSVLITFQRRTYEAS